MISIKYSNRTNEITVIQGKTKREFTASSDVNSQALNLVKQYFIDKITSLCYGRINALNHSQNSNDNKREFLLKTSHSIPDKMKLPTWKEYLSLTLQQLRAVAPHKESRFYRNYIAVLDELEACLKFYKDKKQYHELGEQSKQMQLF